MDALKDAPKTFRFRPIAPEHRYRPIPKAPPALSGPVHVPREIRCEAVSVVVPVKNHQQGIDTLLTSLAALEPAARPKEILIVDNGSDRMTEQRVDCPVPVKLLECKKRGPGPARNVGVSNASGDWILFTDSDCAATPSFVSAYVRDDNTAVGYAGMVQTREVDEYTRFYNDENVFVPAALTTSDGVVPKSLITANCLVLKEALLAVGGFNESFPYASAEDTDMGYRLRMIGSLKYNLNSVVEHVINDGLPGFMQRFVRYGRGHALLSRHYTDPRLFTPPPPRHRVPANTEELLADMCLSCMMWGFLMEMREAR